MVLIKAMLSELGFKYRIIEAKNGIEAVEKYREMNPDLILMDVHMPELDGISATKKIREIELLSGKNVPIIALTAGALKEEKENCFASGMNDFLTKPLIPEKIMEMLNKYLIKQSHLHELPYNEESENELHISYYELGNLFSNKSIIKEAMAIALNDMPTQLLNLEKACKEKDFIKVNAAAHILKGSSSSMRFKIMAQIAEIIESESYENWNDDLTLQFSKLIAEWEIVKKIIHENII